MLVMLMLRLILIKADNVDQWYLRGFDAKAMEPYVDFFGFMAYDLHGFWDADVETLGSK